MVRQLNKMGCGVYRSWQRRAGWSSSNLIDKPTSIEQQNTSRRNQTTQTRTDGAMIGRAESKELGILADLSPFAVGKAASLILTARRLANRRFCPLDSSQSQG